MFFPMQGNFRHILLIQKQKSLISINHRFLLRLFPIFNNTLKTLMHFFGHRNDSGSTWRFRILNNILHSSSPLKLMIYTYLFFFKINIGKRQSAELWNTKSGFKEDKHTIIKFSPHSTSAYNALSTVASATLLKMRPIYLPFHALDRTLWRCKTYAWTGRHQAKRIECR